jgi:hypothetical protein
MGNPAIGSYSFIGDNTPYVTSPNQKLMPLEREGIDGYEMYEVGKRAQPIMWQTFADNSSPATLIAAYNAISGTIQTVTNVDGSTVTYVAVELVACSAKLIAKTVGGLTAGTWGVSATWKLQPTV